MRDLDQVLAVGAASSAVFPPQNAFDFSDGGIAHPVHVKGTGPGVVLMHEMPGMVPEFWRLANWIAAAEFRVYAPDLYAKPGASVTRPSTAGGLARACVTREIHLLSHRGSSPIAGWLRALARRAHAECGGPGVGAVGLCLTGNFAWSLMLEPAVLAPVAGEPSLPLPARPGARASLHLGRDEEAAVRDRADVPVMALRFKGDPVCQRQRFAALRSLVGDARLAAIEIDDAHKNPRGNPFPHAVLTRDLIHADGSPTLAAVRDVLTFLRWRLAG